MHAIWLYFRLGGVVVVKDWNNRIIRCLPEANMKKELLMPSDQVNHIHRYRNFEVVGKKIEIGNGKACDAFYNVDFIDCEARIYCAGYGTKVATPSCRFNRCLIWAHRLRSIPSWTASFESRFLKASTKSDSQGRSKIATFPLSH